MKILLTAIRTGFAYNDPWGGTGAHQRLLAGYEENFMLMDCRQESRRESDMQLNAVINQLYRKIMNGDSERKIQIGASSMTPDEWDKLLRKVDNNISRETEEPKRDKTVVDRGKFREEKVSVYEKLYMETQSTRNRLGEAERVSDEKNYKDASSANYKIEYSQEIGIHLFTIYDKNGEKIAVVEDEDVFVQKDANSGMEVMISSIGRETIYHAFPLDEELKGLLAEATDVEQLEVKPLEGFTIERHPETGIHFIYRNGEAGRGGTLLFQNDAEVEKYNSLVNSYQNDYPNLTGNPEIAKLYATLEVMGMAARTLDGILTMHQGGISYNDEHDSRNMWNIRLRDEGEENFKTLMDMFRSSGMSKYECQFIKNWKDILEKFDYERIWSDEEVKGALVF